MLYYGREEPRKPESGGRLPTALVFPGKRSLALSTLGWQAVYRLLAGCSELAVERFFPTPGTAPISEEGTVLSAFPVVALSVNVEEELLHLLDVLEAGGVPSAKAGRPDFPLVIAGGPLAFLNPAPLSPLADLLFIGEAEAGLRDLLVEIKSLWMAGVSKTETLDAVKNRPGVYVPGLSATPVRRVIAPGPGLPDPAFSCFIGSDTTFKDTLLLEVNRGCPYGCRFCAAGYVYRPPRHARIQDLKQIVESTNPPKVGLVGTALTDWPDLLPFLIWLKERKTKFSLSSLRADGLTEELLAFLRVCGLRTITLALEAPSMRLRDMASKKLDPNDFLEAVRLCSSHGVNHLRIYLITGWPGETDDDYAELDSFLTEVVALRDASQKRKKEFMRITLGVSCLVPKPHTPFQWAPMASEADLDRRMKQLKTMTKRHRGVTLSPDNPSQARLQGLLARGGEDIFGLAQLALKLGGWKKALYQWKGDATLMDRELGRNDPLPWDVIDSGVSKDFLWKEWLRSKEQKPSPGCPDKGCAHCRRCGVDELPSLDSNLEPSV
ncbi:MAG: radical SAM protein [Proteobacteria bacterium]|nr:radical SAM protein [Pseudomonadota bacterium]